MKKYLILLFSLVTVFGYAQTKIDPALSPTTARINEAIQGSIAASGTDTYTGTLTGLTNVTNKAYDVTFTNANTGSATFNLNATGAVTIRKFESGSLVNLVAGDISAGETKRLRYNGTYLVIEGGSGSGSSSDPVYTWTETFDDDPTLSGGQTSGLNSTFTLTNTPVSLNNVSLNGLILDKDQYSLSGTTLTILDRNLRLLNTSSITRSGTTATVVIQYEFTELAVGSIITVSGASNAALNGTFYVTSVNAGTFTYTTPTSGTISAVTNASISFYSPPSKKSSVKVEYLYSSVQPAITRYNAANINNVVFYGNSLFYGVGSEHNISDVVTQIKSMLPSVPFRIVNLGSPGITTSALDTYIAQVLTPQLSTSYNKNIIVVTEIVNDHAVHPGDSDATLFAHYKTLCQNIKALNPSYIVVATTILNTSGYISEVSRVAINNMIIADPSFYDYLINTTTNTSIGVAGAHTDTDYYNADGLHLYPEGYFEWAKEMYPVIMTACGLSVQDISALPVLTSNNNILRQGGNYNLSTSSSSTVGTFRNIPFHFNTFGLSRGNISANGLWTINPTVTATTPKGLSVTPDLGDDNATNVSHGLYIRATNNRVNILRQFEVVSSGGTSAFYIGNNTLGSGSGNGLIPISAVNSNVSVGNFVIDSDLNSSATPETGMLNFKSASDGTSNAYYIGKLSGDLYYNVANNFNHSFRIAGTERFGVGASNTIYAPYAQAYSVTGQSDLPVSTKTGIVFNAPGGTANDVIITRTSSSGSGRGLIYKVGSTGSHAFTIGDTEKVTIDVDGELGVNNTSPNSTLTVSGSFGAAISTITSTTTLDATYHTVLVDATGGAVTVNLPTAASSTRRVYIIKKIDVGVNAVTIEPNGSEQIDGSTNSTISVTMQLQMIQSNGTAWYIVGN